MTILLPSQVPLAPIEKFEGLYYGFPYGFDTQVRKLCDAFHQCEAPTAYARFLQRIGMPTWLLPYAPDDSADPFRRRMASVLQAMNADIVLVPEAQRASSLTAGLRNTIRLSHHTMGKVDRTWHYKVAYLPGFYHFDREGFSGWSELAHATAAEVEQVPADAAENYWNGRIAALRNARKSKYAQDEAAAFEHQDFAFIPLQLPDDSVIALGHSKDYLGTMRDAARLLRGRGLPVVLKRHPLCHDDRVAALLAALEAEGCIATTASIHRILPAAKAVVTLNSGVGFEALLHLKPVICLGRSDYALAGWEAKTMEALDTALGQITPGRPVPFLKRFLYLALNKYQVDLNADISSKQHALRAICWNYLSLPRP